MTKGLDSLKIELIFKNIFIHSELQGIDFETQNFHKYTCQQVHTYIFGLGRIATQKKFFSPVKNPSKDHDTS